MDKRYATDIKSGWWIFEWYATIKILLDYFISLNWEPNSTNCNSLKLSIVKIACQMMMRIQKCVRHMIAVQNDGNVIKEIIFNALIWNQGLYILYWCLQSKRFTTLNSVAKSKHDHTFSDATESSTVAMLRMNSIVRTMLKMKIPGIFFYSFRFRFHPFNTDR